MRLGLFVLAALLLTYGVQVPTPIYTQQVMSLKGMESTRATASTDIRIRPLSEDKGNFYPWIMELKEALRGRELLGALRPDDPEAAKVTALEDTIARENEAAKAKLQLKRIMNEIQCATS